jgi:transcriptional regulator with XRE-family HTH domain
MLASKAELNDKYLGSVERGQQAASLDTIAKIAAGLGVPIHELFVRQDQSADELRARAGELLAEAGDDELRRVVAVLEAMLH